jgi:DNA-binding transcriptional regulator YdaS (Cro superfamily)
MRRLTRQRRERIILAYVVATGGRLPTHLGRLLAAMRARMGEVSEEEVRRAIAWVLKPRRRSGVLLPRPQATQDGREQS